MERILKTVPFTHYIMSGPPHKLVGKNNNNNNAVLRNGTSEPDSGKAEMLELSYWKFKTIMINILRDLMDVIDSRQE